MIRSKDDLKPSIDRAEKILVIFPGGEDVNPKYYNQRNTHSFINERRDVHEFDIARLCCSFPGTIKMLGICRGHQLLNVVDGGTLIQDINIYNGKNFPEERIIHPGQHSVDKYREDGGKITTHFTEVNSMHHQAVLRVGFHFDPILKYGNVIESMESENAITVQFHPEFMDDPETLFFWDKIKQWITEPAKNKENIITIGRNSLNDLFRGASILRQSSEPGIFRTPYSSNDFIAYDTSSTTTYATALEENENEENNEEDEEFDEEDDN